MIRFAFAAGLLLILGRPASVMAQTCPPEYPTTRVLVERFLTRPAHQQSRQETGLAGAPTSPVRVLLNGTDDGACQLLNNAVGSSAGQSGSWRWTYYAAGGRFFVALHHVDEPGTRRVGFVGLYVFDDYGNLLGSYAM